MRMIHVFPYANIDLLERLEATRAVLPDAGVLIAALRHMILVHVLKYATETE